jgi:hypothetical protein
MLKLCCQSRLQKETKNNAKTYNTRSSLVVTDPATDLALAGLTLRERTGSRNFQWLWSYVSVKLVALGYSSESRMLVLR